MKKYILILIIFPVTLFAQKSVGLLSIDDVIYNDLLKIDFFENTLVIGSIYDLPEVPNVKSLKTNKFAIDENLLISKEGMSTIISSGIKKPFIHAYSLKFPIYPIYLNYGISEEKNSGRYQLNLYKFENNLWMYVNTLYVNNYSVAQYTKFNLFVIENTIIFTINVVDLESGRKKLLISRSNNNGISFTTSEHSSIIRGIVISIYFENENRGFILNNYNDIYLSENGGVDWNYFDHFNYNWTNYLPGIEIDTVSASPFNLYKVITK